MCTTKVIIICQGRVVCKSRVLVKIDSQKDIADGNRGGQEWWHKP